MFQSPNDKNNIKRNQRDNSYSMGDNNLSVRFNKALAVLLSTEYYEGSIFGKVYNKNRADGKSQIYVDQPEMENRIKNHFINKEDDLVKYLIGPTGVGKTTLLRNVFYVFDRNVVSNNNNLIIYISFYSMTSYSDGKKIKKDIVIDTVIRSIKGAISYLSGKDLIQRISEYDDEFYESFYYFISINNKALLDSYNENSKKNKKFKKKNGKKIILDWLAKHEPLDYYMSQLKYYINTYNGEKNKLKNVIFVFDDVESLSSEHVDEIINCAYHCQKCLQANSNRTYYFKALISMRNYSYRIQHIRRKEAFREILWDDVIMKDIVPELSAVIKKRTEYVLGLREVKDSVVDRDSFKTASDNLLFLLSKMYGQYDKMLLSLTHNDIFKSMKLLFRILTNKAFIGKYEIDRTENRGAFVINQEDYHLENKANYSNNPSNDDVYYALVYGEQKVYYDKKDYYLTNIMHFKYDDGANTELLGIYIIQYFIKKGVNLADSTYDGFESILCTKAINEIMSLYEFNSDEKKSNFIKGLEFMMKHLYEGGALLQSIIEPIEEEIDINGREYLPEMKVYLSLRGCQLYNMLSYNALLFTTYRDDIDTDIVGNNTLSLNMTMDERMIYCLTYMDYLADLEIDILRDVSNYKKYINLIGDKLATYILMKGMKETINVYFKNDTEYKKIIIEKYGIIQNKINDFLNNINKKFKVELKNID